MNLLDHRMNLTDLARLTSSFAVLAALLAQPVAAQNPPTQLPDTLRQRLLKCGTHSEVLRQQRSTNAARTALTNVSSCPEGPVVLAELWRGTDGSDEAFLASLATLSSLSRPAIVDAMLDAVTDRRRPEIVRRRAMGAFLQHLTGEFDSEIKLERVTMLSDFRRDSTGRVVEVPTDSVKWDARFVSRPGRISRVSPVLRERIIASIDVVANDQSENNNLRLVAEAVRRTLQSRRYQQ